MDAPLPGADGRGRGGRDRSARTLRAGRLRPRRGGGALARHGARRALRHARADPWHPRGSTVTPANAGAHSVSERPAWVPAFAGMTTWARHRASAFFLAIYLPSTWMVLR